MVASLVVLVMWNVLGVIGLWFEDAFVKARKCDVNAPMVLFLVLIPCLPFIFHLCGLF